MHILHNQVDCSYRIVCCQGRVSVAILAQVYSWTDRGCAKRRRRLGLYNFRRLRAHELRANVGRIVSTKALDAVATVAKKTASSLMQRPATALLKRTAAACQSV